MESLSQIKRAEINEIKVLLFDLDGTFVSDGRLKSSTFECLEKLRQKKIKRIAVTGRPAGWCDLIARWWPVNSVVGENGAFSYTISDGRIIRKTFDSSSSLSAHQKKLNLLFDDIKSNFGGVHLAADQPFRQWDLALDISEEQDMDDYKVKAIYDFCISNGANAAISNIHLNVWYGNYNKLDMSLKILDEWNLKEHECMYIGDSPNDSPMFNYFSFSVGVKSVLKYKDIMDYFPSYLTTRDSSEGFEELTNLIL